MTLFANKFVSKINVSAFYQYMAMISGTLGVICSGMHYGWPSPSLPQLVKLNSTIPVTGEEGSWIAVMPLVGAVFGSIIGATILDVIGRKRVVLLSCFPYCATWITIAFTNSVVVLYVARFVAGIMDGLIFCAIPMYLGEIADPSIRGALGSSVSVTWIFGTLLINAIGSYLSISTTALISSIVPILCFVTFVFMPESPYYLIMKGDIDQAKKNLKIFKGRDNVEKESQRLIKAVEEQQKDSGKCLDLFTVKSNRRALIIMLGIRGAQQLSGTSAITFYAKTIFQHAGESNIVSSSDAAVIYFSIQLLICAICSLLVDKVGRRPLLFVSTIGSGFALLTEGLYFCAVNEFNVNLEGYSWIPLVALICFVVTFSLGMQTIPILLLGELFPTNVKAFALCLADIYFSAVATIVSKAFQFTKDNYGLHYPFFGFFVCCMLGLIFIIFFVPETKGKSLEEIQDELRGNIKTRGKEAIESGEIFKELPEEP